MSSKRILLVGAGGIGCEILKNLVLMDYNHIDVVDMDTIELSNLNRQFLFRQQHVGKAKSKVAVEVVLEFAPSRDVRSFVDDIRAVAADFFSHYIIVFNALDNIEARSYVNRMCVALQTPLIESGTAGYMGQASPIIPFTTPCYDCYPKPSGKTYPACTIRNTPSKMIHCVVWAKALFNQLFGGSSENDEVSPDPTDENAMIDDGQKGDDRSGPNHENNRKQQLAETDLVDEAKLAHVTAGEAYQGNEAKQQTALSTLVEQRISTRKWALEHGYDGKVIFDKVFNDDIKLLLSMSNLWKTRDPPSPISFDCIGGFVNPRSRGCGEVHKVAAMNAPMDIGELAFVFNRSVNNLRQELKGAPIEFDKIHAPSMEFVYAAANIRAISFHIETASLFEIKSQAGNIIPAIASTNAIVAALAVHQGRVLLSSKERPFDVFVKPNRVVPWADNLGPHPDCYTCGGQYSLSMSLHPARCTLAQLRAAISSKLGVEGPIELLLADGRLLPDEGGPTDRLLSDFGIGDRGASVVTAQTDSDQRVQIVVRKKQHSGQGQIEVWQTRGIKRKRARNPSHRR